MNEVTTIEQRGLIEVPGDLAPTSLILKPGLDRKALGEVEEQLDTASQSINWWRGDLFVYALENLTGDDLEEYKAVLRKDSSMRVYHAVAKHFPPERRCYPGSKIKWSCFRELVRVEDPATGKKNAEIRFRFVEMAAKHGWDSKRCLARALAWNAGDTGAINEKWVPTAAGKTDGRVTKGPETDDTNSDNAESGGVFDNTSAGEGMAQESVLPPRGDDDQPMGGGDDRAHEGPTDAGQMLLDTIVRVEAIKPKDESALRDARLRWKRVKAAGQRLIDIAENNDPSLKNTGSTEPGSVREERPAVSTLPEPARQSGGDQNTETRPAISVSEDVSASDNGKNGGDDAPAAAETGGTAPPSVDESPQAKPEITAPAGGHSNVAPTEDEDIPAFLDRRPGRPGESDADHVVEPNKMVPVEGKVT